jgi:hypothetical protein
MVYFMGPHVAGGQPLAEEFVYALMDRHELGALTRATDARQQLGEPRVLADRVDTGVEAYRCEARFFQIAASPKPAEREVIIADCDAHQIQIERPPRSSQR